LDPSNVDILYNKGVALGKLGDYTQAISYYDRALAIEPTYTGALTGKGFALHQLRSNIQAIVYYDKALAIDPSNVDTLTNKGLLLLLCINILKQSSIMTRL
jgi:tetratricopeptide (TPR) repeat protein